ncbi:MAG: hypothetical protein EXR01_07575 [Acetobacteraceae bacterium]|nr:hypothetical protein [Acetobacteraceae bacterium]
MTKEEITAWALANGWRVLGGTLCLTKPSAPKEAIVRLVFKTTVVNLEVKKPAGKWEKLGGESYNKIEIDPETDMPSGLDLETMPAFRMLMSENKDQQVFARMTGAPKRD